MSFTAESPTSAPGTASWSLTAIIYIIFALPTLSLLTLAIYRLFFHPLARVPGPRLAALSNVWYGYQVCRGRMLQLGKTLHEQYGPIVRVGPNEVWLSSDEGFRRVYVVGSGFEKSDFYLSTALQKPKVDWRLQPHFPDTLDLLSERDMRRYRLQRRLIGQVYQAANLRKFEKTIDAVLDQVVVKIRSLGGAEVDLKEWMHIITVECLGGVVLSWSPGYLKAGSDFGSGSFSYLGWRRKTIFGLFPSAAMVGVLSRSFERAFANAWGLTFKAPKTLRHFFPAVHRKVKPRLVNMMQEKPRKDGREDLMADLIQLHKSKPEFNRTYLHRMAITNFGAGHETTTSALTSVIAMLGTHLEFQARVAREIKDSRGGRPGKRDGELDASSCSISQRTSLTAAAIKEAQRLYPVIGMSLPRRVPASGLEIHGFFVPAGSTVGCNLTSLHRNKEIFGTDADVYNPDRWLQDEWRTRAMERCNLTWGGGARACPGKSLAEMILHRTVGRLVEEFEVTCQVPRDDEMCYYFMAMLTGVKVRFLDRQTRWSKEED